MAFNTDVGVDELFDKVYFLVTKTKGDGKSILELSYCIGLPVGIIVFFDHFKPAVRRQANTPQETAKPAEIPIKINTIVWNTSCQSSN